MINEKHLENAIEIAKEEIADYDDISASDLEDFRKRLNHLIDVILKNDLEEEDTPKQ